MELIKCTVTVIRRARAWGKAPTWKRDASVLAWLDAL
jgi:hypothetical protein